MLMVTDGQMQATHSQPTVLSGKTEMETTTETILTGTMLMHSPMIQASGQTVTAMATEIDQSYPMVISSLTTLLSGATQTVMDMETTLMGTKVTNVQNFMVNLQYLQQEAVPIQTMMESSTRSTHSLMISTSRPTKTMMVGETTKRFQTEMSAQTKLAQVQTIQDKAAPMQITIHGQMLMTCSQMTHSSGKILTSMDGVTIMAG